jgi:hypothetical protein
MTDLFRIASKWDRLTDEARQPLRRTIQELVDYPCKIACKKHSGIVDIFAFDPTLNTITDWLELQSSGAFGVIFNMYPDVDAPAVQGLEERCQAYNEELGVEFEESESESESDETESDESHDSESDTGSEGGQDQDEPME